MQTKDIIKEWAGNKDRLFQYRQYESSNWEYVVITDVRYRKEKNGRVTTLFEYEQIYTHGLTWDGTETEFNRSSKQWSKARYFELMYETTWDMYYKNRSEQTQERLSNEAVAQSKRDTIDTLMQELHIGFRHSKEFRRGHDWRTHHYQWELKEYRKDGEDGMDALIATLRDAKKFYDLIASGAITLPDTEEQEMA
jgi:hypothetical protein